MSSDDDQSLNIIKEYLMSLGLTKTLDIMKSEIEEQNVFFYVFINSYSKKEIKVKANTKQLIVNSQYFIKFLNTTLGNIINYI